MTSVGIERMGLYAGAAFVDVFASTSKTIHPFEERLFIERR